MKPEFQNWLRQLQMHSAGGHVRCGNLFARIQASSYASDIPSAVRSRYEDLAGTAFATLLASGISSGEAVLGVHDTAVTKGSLELFFKGPTAPSLKPSISRVLSATSLFAYLVDASASTPPISAHTDDHEAAVKYIADKGYVAQRRARIRGRFSELAFATCTDLLDREIAFARSRAGDRAAEHIRDLLGLGDLGVPEPTPEEQQRGTVLLKLRYPDDKSKSLSLFRPTVLDSDANSLFVPQAAHPPHAKGYETWGCTTVTGEVRRERASLPTSRERFRGLPEVVHPSFEFDNRFQPELIGSVLAITEFAPDLSGEIV